MTPAPIAETFDDRWVRWQARAAVQDRRWRRATVATATAVGCALLAWLAVTLLAA